MKERTVSVVRDGDGQPLGRVVEREGSLSWRLLIPRAISSQNRSGMNKGAARYGYKTERDRWAWDIKMAAKALGVPTATAKRKVTITRLMGKGQREFDIPNLWGGIKALCDAMCLDRVYRGKTRPGAGIIVDDSPKWAEFAVEQCRSATGEPATLLLIEDIS